MRIAVLGAGGFIGGHLCKHLVEEGHDVFAVDIKPLGDWWQRWGLTVPGYDMCSESLATFVTKGCDRVYDLCCLMGGIGRIETHREDAIESTLISTNIIRACIFNKVGRLFYSSSACVYSGIRQRDSGATALKESDVLPYDAERGYGWQKLYTEFMLDWARESCGLDSRIARFHNVMGPFGTYVGGKEKAPAAICRKVIEAKLSGRHEIEIWGDGNQTRSFCYIDDCVKGIQAIMDGEFPLPVNLGSSEQVSINQLVDLVEDIAEVKLKRVYKPDAPRGVAGRNSDNTLFKSLYGWESSTPLRQGLWQTYRWIYDRLVPH